MEGAWAAVVRNATGKQQREKWSCKERTQEEGLQHVRGRGAVRQRSRDLREEERNGGSAR